MADVIVGQAPEVTVWITAAVEREFKRRDVFQKLRAQHARQIISGSTAVHRLSREEAEQLLADIDAQLAYPARYQLPRGVSKALGSLAISLRAALKPATGLADNSDEIAAEWRRKAAEAEAEVKRATDQLADLPKSKKQFAERAAHLFWNGGVNVFFAIYGQREPR